MNRALAPVAVPTAQPPAEPPVFVTPRPLDLYRVAELCPPLTKPTALRLIASGELEAVHVGKMLFVTGASLRRLFRVKA
jgi:hypothetical protein